MEQVMAVAAVLYQKYQQRNSKGYMDEMKMHKLMYFVQRESYIKNNAPMFEEDFYGWKYGPVLKSIRSAYMEKIDFSKQNVKLCPENETLVMDVLHKYGMLKSWKLSALTHREKSWLYSRKGLDNGENGDVMILKEHILLDAQNEKLNREMEV